MLNNWNMLALLLALACSSTSTTKFVVSDGGGSAGSSGGEAGTEAGGTSGFAGTYWTGGAGTYGGTAGLAGTGVAGDTGGQDAGNDAYAADANTPDGPPPMDCKQICGGISICCYKEFCPVPPDAMSACCVTDCLCGGNFGNGCEPVDPWWDQ